MVNMKSNRGQTITIDLGVDRSSSPLSIGSGNSFSVLYTTGTFWIEVIYPNGLTDTIPEEALITGFYLEEEFADIKIYNNPQAGKKAIVHKSWSAY